MKNNEFIGKKSLENIRFIIKEEKVRKIIIFAGEKSYALSGAEENLKTILSNVNHKTIFKTKNYPNMLDLNNFVENIKNFKPNLIIAIGGGAVLDLAKMSNCLFNNLDIEESIKNSNYELKKFCSLIAVPTTAGSGAEATSNAVIYINKIKFSIEGTAIKPDYILIDPSLILSTPTNIAAAAGMDAIAQAIESLISKKSTIESVEYSIKSLEHLLASYENHIKNKNFESSYKMSIGALNAGKAINISKTTAPHAVSYPFTSHHGVSHGHAVVLTLPDFLSFNFKNLKYSKTSFDLKKRFDIIFKAFNVQNIINLENKIKLLAQNTGLELNFNKLKITQKSQIDTILGQINKQRLMNNPIELEISNIERILLSKLQ